MFIRLEPSGAGGEPNAAALRSNPARASSYALVPFAAQWLFAANNCPEPGQI